MSGLKALNSGADPKCPGECSVCGTSGAEAGALGCGHQFCLDCYGRFIAGSVKELFTRLRCCVCGHINPLVKEMNQEEVLNEFGRDTSAALATPVGITLLPDTGDYVLIDRSHRRLFVFNAFGQLVKDFGHIFGHTAVKGLAVDKEGHTLVPLQKDNRSHLGIYSHTGSFLNSIYLPAGTNIEGITVNTQNKILVSDSAKNLVYTIQNQRVKSFIHVEQFNDEHFPPRLAGVAANSFDDVIVIDTANQRIRVYDSAGTFKFKFGGKGSQAGQFFQASDLCVDAKDNIIVADTGNNRVQLFSPNGTFLRFIVRYNCGPDVYMAPSGVVATSMNEVAVLLQGNRAATAGQVRVYHISGPRT